MTIEKTAFTMYVKETCPYCIKAREYILNDLNASVHTIDVTNQRDLHAMLIEDTGHKTVPAVFLGNKFIGGCDALIEFGNTTEGILHIIKQEMSILREEVSKLRKSL